MVRRGRRLLGAAGILVALLAHPDGPAAADDPPPPTIWAVGDSITAGIGTGDPALYSYPARLRAMGLDVLAVGTPGQCLVVSGCRQTPSMLETVGAVLTGVHPGDVLVLEGGTNDLGLATLPQLKRGYRAIVRAGEGLGIHVVVTTITPRATWRWWPNGTAEHDRVRINAWLRSRGWLVADTDVALGTYPFGPLAPRFDSGDGLHPNAAGARAMAVTVAAMLSSSL